MQTHPPHKAGRCVHSTNANVPRKTFSLSETKNFSECFLLKAGLLHWIGKKSSINKKVANSSHPNLIRQVTQRLWLK